MSQATSAASSIPLGLEYGIASCLALALLVKKKPNRNFSISLAYSSIKLLAISSNLAGNMNFFGLSVVPFLLGLLVNEVVLLVLSIRLREIILLVPYSVLYRRRVRAVRFVSELSSVIIIVCVVMVQPFISCSCAPAEDVFGFKYCEKSDTEAIVGAMLTNQIKGLAFAISVTGSIAAVSSIRFMASSIGKEISGSKDRDVIQWMMMDAGWKQAIRTVYGVLGIFVNGLFVFTFFYTGTNNCVFDDTGADAGADAGVNTGDEAGVNTGDDTGIGTGTSQSGKYAMGPVPSALLNAIMAISQVFMADMLFRIAGEASNIWQDNQKLSFRNTDVSHDVGPAGTTSPSGTTPSVSTAAVLPTEAIPPSVPVPPAGIVPPTVPVPPAGIVPPTVPVPSTVPVPPTVPVLPAGAFSTSSARNYV